MLHHVQYLPVPENAQERQIGEPGAGCIVFFFPLNLIKAIMLIAPVQHLRIKVILMGMSAKQQLRREQINVELHRLIENISGKINQTGIREMDGTVKAYIPSSFLPGITAIVTVAPGSGIQFRRCCAQKSYFHAFLLFNFS